MQGWYGILSRSRRKLPFAWLCRDVEPAMCENLAPIRIAPNLGRVSHQCTQPPRKGAPHYALPFEEDEPDPDEGFEPEDELDSEEELDPEEAFDPEE